LLLVLGAGLRWGSPPAARADETPSARADDAKAAAHEHFDKALAATNAQRFGEAAAEFQKAYELWPDFKVLYNLGRVRVALGQPVEVVDAFEAYLTEGGDAIPTERKEEVRREIEDQRAHIATITVQVSADGADVRLDGRLVGHSPLPGPVRVAAGRHAIEALLPERPAQLQDVDVPGASTMEVVFKFPPKVELGAPVESRVPAAPVVVDAPRKRTIGYVVGGIGLGTVIGGAALAFEGVFAANDARARLVAAATPLPPGIPDAAKYDEAKRAYDDAKTRNQLGWAIAGIGGAAVIGGAALVIVSSGGASRSGHDGGVGVVAQPGGLAFRGTW
jgi:tetratricopeptide (TPR) repeat protein